MSLNAVDNHIATLLFPTIQNMLHNAPRHTVKTTIGSNLWQLKAEGSSWKVVFMEFYVFLLVKNRCHYCI